LHIQDHQQSSNLPVGSDNLPINSENLLVHSPSLPNKYFSVKGFQQLVQLNKPQETKEKYFSVDSSFLTSNPDVRTKVRQSVTVETYQKPEFEQIMEIVNKNSMVITNKMAEKPCPSM